MKDHLHDWYHGSNGKIVSMGVVSQGDYNIPKGLWTSLPVVCSNFSYTISRDAKVEPFCQTKIEITVQELQAELADAEITL